MTFRLLIEEVRQAISTSVVNLGYPMPDFSVSEPPREFGDITCNVAFQLGKLLKRRPSEIADEIIKKELSPYLDNNTQSLIASVESHQAGYINFRANFRRLSS